MTTWPEERVLCTQSCNTSFLCKSLKKAEKAPTAQMSLRMHFSSGEQRAIPACLWVLCGEDFPVCRSVSALSALRLLSVPFE